MFSTACRTNPSSTPDAPVSRRMTVSPPSCFRSWSVATVKACSVGPPLGERQRAGGDGDVVAFGCGGAGKHRVVDGDLLRVVVAQWATEAYGHRRGAALGDAEAPGGEGHRQRRHAGRSEQRHLVEEVAARTAGVQRAEGPAMDLGQRQAVVRCAVADVLAREAGEREAELPPAREVVGEGDRQALGVVLRGAGVPVVEDVHEQGRRRCPSRTARTRSPRSGSSPAASRWWAGRRRSCARSRRTTSRPGPPGGRCSASRPPGGWPEVWSWWRGPRCWTRPGR